MGFFQNIFGAAPPKPTVPQALPVSAPSVPQRLPKIAAPTAAKVCQEYKPEPAAQALLTPQQTPAQFLDALQKKQVPDESVKFLAYGLPERESVWWATQCAQKVSSPLNLRDQAAIQAADAWVKNPSESTKQAAADAAAKTDFQTPGAWAAQAAAWTKPVSPGAPVSDAAVKPRLAPHAVAGAVMLAVAVKANKIPAVPKAQTPQLGTSLPNADVSQLSAPGLSKLSLPASPQVAAGGGLSSLAAARGRVSAAVNVAPLGGTGASMAKAGAWSQSAGNAGLPNPSLPALAAANPRMPAAGTLAPSASNAGLSGPNLSSLAVANPGMPGTRALPPVPNAGLPTANMPSLAMPKVGGANLSAPPVSAPSLNAPDLKAPELAKPQLSPQERLELSNTSAPFIKLGMDIASGAVSLV